ncbi:hypothetical protein GCM10023115_24950 [Pontixanthobacter gangjinensis]|uniref:Uncharacterized protein n=1 Tax=Christiangramia aestuarii TaxID=1028746 RepID=A0A7K1LSY3_9FLAO|nr:hypothetical protein [Christiangramia aestuarii]MUP43925.1 hypothetical protein [Christiangramia aestuarii]
MPTTTDFQEYLDNLEEDHIEIIHELYESVSGEYQMGAFETERNNGNLFTTSDLNDFTLMLVSDEARDAFLKKLDQDYGGDFGWVGGHYEFVRSMNKDD